MGNSLIQDWYRWGQCIFRTQEIWRVPEAFWTKSSLLYVQSQLRSIREGTQYRQSQGCYIFSSYLEHTKLAWQHQSQHVFDYSQLKTWNLRQLFSAFLYILGDWRISEVMKQLPSYLYLLVILEGYHQEHVFSAVLALIIFFLHYTLIPSLLQYNC